MWVTFPFPHLQTLEDPWKTLKTLRLPVNNSTAIWRNACRRHCRLPKTDFSPSSTALYCTCH